MDNTYTPLVIKCPACFRDTDRFPVKIRREGSKEWVDSSILRCSDPECGFTSGGTIEERMVYVTNETEYKYFGDYELTPIQVDAVNTAIGVANELLADRKQTHAELAELRAENERMREEVRGLSVDDKDRRIAELEAAGGAMCAAIINAFESDETTYEELAKAVVPSANQWMKMRMKQEGMQSLNTDSNGK